jgi:hypothetical protein
VNAAKRNLSIRRVGKGRGVPIRLARGIARKYNLSQLIIWTYDRQKRQRILSWGSSDGPALVASGFAKGVALSLGWPEESADFEMGFIRRMKRRMEELEVALARIVDGEPDALSLARAAGKFPDQSENGQHGDWRFFPKNKLPVAEQLLRDRRDPGSLAIAAVTHS